MPPRKLTQEEKNKIRQDELERKALEEEQIRIKEEELKEREERERIAREERVRELQEETARFDIERTQLSELLSKREHSLSVSTQQQLSEYEWKRYTRCPITPDPYCLKEINTYLTLWRESPAHTSFESLREKVEEVNAFTQEMRSLQDLGLAPVSHPVDFSSVTEQIHDILSAKMDSTTLEVMWNPTGLLDDLYGNLKTEIKLDESADNSLSVSLWGNIASNHRMSEVDFQHRNFSIEASQRGLQVPNVALRVTHTTRDLYSPTSRSYAPRPVVTFSDEEPSQSDLTTEQVERNPKSSATSSRKGSAVNVNSQTSVTAKPQSASSRSGLANENKEGSGTEMNKVAEPSNTDVAEVCKVKEEVEQMQIEECEVDLRQFSPLGPITLLEYIRLPPQPRVMGQWQMQELEPYLIRHNSYPILQAGQDITQIAPGSKLWPFVCVSMNIPDNLVVSQESKVARWSKELCQWRTDEFTDLKVDLENRIISFKCNSFSPIALMQDHYLNMPYQGWTVQPMGLNSTKLLITGNLHQFEIVIEKDKCYLVKPDLSELTGLINTPLLVNRFIPVLKSHGLNLFPVEDAPNYVAVSNKDADVEKDVYRDMSLLSGSGVNFTWSSWNASCHGDQYVLRVCKNDGDTLPDVHEWDLVLVGTKCYKLSMKELSEEFSDTRLPDHKTHSSLYNVLRGDNTVDSNVDISHREAIRELLSVIRPLVFT